MRVAWFGFLPVVAIVGTAWMWNGPETRPTSAKSGPTEIDLADEATDELEGRRHLADC